MIPYEELEPGWYWAIENEISFVLDKDKELKPHYVYKDNNALSCSYDLALDYIARCKPELMECEFCHSGVYPDYDNGTDDPVKCEYCNGTGYREKE